MPIVNQVENIIRMALSFSILFFIFPRLIFRERGGGLEGFFSRYVKMVFLIVVAGYILAAIKLFEFLSIFVFFLFCWVVNKYYLSKSEQTLDQRLSAMMAVFLDIFDGNFSYAWLQIKTKEYGSVLKKKWVTFSRNPSTLLLLAVIALASYLRFYDPMAHATPGMSDASVNLAWVKYITMNILFHDGIYPHGLHIYLATLFKFAGDDAIYIFKYAGPLNGILTCLGLYLFLSKITGRKTAGIVGAFVYGVLGYLLPLGWERQATTFPQEFGLVFLLPAWHFTIRYLETKENRFLWNAAAAFAVMGLTHTVGYAILVLGVVLILFIYFLFGIRKNIKAILHLSLAGIASGLISVIPMLYGFLMGKTFHASSLEYLTLEAITTITKLTQFDKGVLIGIGCMGLLLIWNIFKRRRSESLIFIMLLGATSYIAYVYLGYWTGNAVIVTRVGLLWAIFACLSIGMAWHVFLQFLPFIRPRIEFLLCIVLLAATTLHYRPEPAVPYKMMNDSMINQYLNISHEYLPTTWMMVSNEEGYWLSLYMAWHTHLWDFLSYSPFEEIIAKKDENGQKQVLDTEDIFIFIEKEVFDPHLGIYEPIVSERIKNYGLLEEWIRTFRAYHEDITIYYEGDDLIVYHIHQNLEKKY